MTWTHKGRNSILDYTFDTFVGFRLIYEKESGNESMHLSKVIAIGGLQQSPQGKISLIKSCWCWAQESNVRCFSYDPEYGFDPDCYRGEGGRDSGYSTHGQVWWQPWGKCQALVQSPMSWSTREQKFDYGLSLSLIDDLIVLSTSKV